MIIQVYGIQKCKRIFTKIKKKEGDKIISEIKKKKNYFTLMLHNGFLFLKIIEKLFKDFKFINIERSPIMLAEAWYKKNYFYKGYQNPRHSVLLMDYKKKGIPYFLTSNIDKFLKLSKMDSIIFNIKNLRKKQETINKRKNYYFCCFEKLSFNTLEELERIQKFLKVKQTNFTNLLFENEGCPRIFSNKNYQKTIEFVRSKISKKYFEILLAEEKKHIKKFNLPLNFEKISTTKIGKKSK